MTTVLIVDANMIYREGLQALLSREPDFTVVGQTGSCEEAVGMVMTLGPDLVLMDPHLPCDCGFNALRSIVADRPETAVVFLGSVDSDDALLEAVQLGARGYMPKGTPFASLVAALRGLDHGELALSRQVLRRIVEKYRRNGDHLGAGPEALTSLTNRERQVLHMLESGADNRRIAEQLVISEHTVKVHVHNILDKLHLRNRAQAASFAQRNHLSRTPPHGIAN